ncbi:Crp/Fnr family transcriptional regulator [Inhella gelatinilytica]|uniref:Crp/Fnr family transcriptional regulator n=1 Tax=Inhella gelatinilytica TaxID=2795030 RepID=A0A931NC66_9BURK|nr:Crp/Fnr family transcriptional regulator [Inhella gelatinilytica]MBH9554358.1 Crp/Fnr family transcriptional regulator [Inhella gelatinilytica]
MPTLLESLWHVAQAELAGAVPLAPPPLGLHDELQRHLVQRRLRAGAVLFAAGQRPGAFYAVLEGEIVCSLLGPDGSASVLEHVGPPHFFGLAAFVTGQPSTYEARAHGATRLLAITPPAYLALMDGWPGFARALLAHFGARFAGNLQQLEAARHRPAAERLALALQQLRRERGRAEGGSTWVPATQAELAALAGVTRQTANEWLARQGGVVRGYGGMWLG